MSGIFDRRIHRGFHLRVHSAGDLIFLRDADAHALQRLIELIQDNPARADQRWWNPSDRGR